MDECKPLAHGDPAALKKTSLQLCRIVKYNDGIVPRLEQLSSGSGVSVAFTEFLRTLGDVRGRGLGSYTVQLNASKVLGYVGCMISPQSIRQGHTGRCDQNGIF